MITEKYQDSKGNIHTLTTDTEVAILEDMRSLTKILADKYKEIERLHSIIKEAREYNEHLIRDAKYHLNEGHLKKMKKILDKVDDNK